MTSVAIIYHSETGTTEKMAKAIEESAQSVAGTHVTMHRVIGKDIQHGRFVNEAILHSATQADALILGSPTYMGTVSAQFKAFADATSEIWSVGKWTNKIAAGFTVGSHYSGDQQSTIQYLQTLAAQHGMLWAGLDIVGMEKETVTNPLGAQSGLILKSTTGRLSTEDLHIASYFGQRIARLLLMRA